jgi:thymidine kinase
MVEEFAFDNADERRKVRQNGTGWVEVIAGSMFSGKSAIDARYSVEEIASHSGQKHDSIPVANTAEMMGLVGEDTQVIGIDEGQFFDMAILDAVNRLAEAGKRVIVAGLDQDYTGKPFEPMPQLLSIAEFITKTHAICVKCGSTANYSQRTVESEARVEVGASDKYEARCRMCFVPHADAPTLHD